MTGAALLELSRWQFAVTAMYHFLFVPLTLGLSILLAIMESVFVMTGRSIWRATRHRGVDGLFSGGDICRPVLLRLGAPVATPAPHRHLVGGNWQQSLGAVDIDRECLDAKSGGGEIQPGLDAHGIAVDIRCDLQSGRSVKIRAYGQRRLRDGSDVRAGNQRLVPAQRAARGVRPSIGDACIELWSGVGALGGGAGG